MIRGKVCFAVLFAFLICNTQSIFNLDVAHAQSDRDDPGDGGSDGGDDGGGGGDSLPRCPDFDPLLQRIFANKGALSVIPTGYTGGVNSYEYGGAALATCSGITVSNLSEVHMLTGAAGTWLSASEKNNLPAFREGFVGLYLDKDLSALDPKKPKAYWRVRLNRVSVQDVTTTGIPVVRYTKVTYLAETPLNFTSSGTSAAFNSNIYVRFMNLERAGSIDGQPSPMALRDITHPSCVFNPYYVTSFFTKLLSAPNSRLSCATEPPPLNPPPAISSDSSTVILNREIVPFSALPDPNSGERAIDKVAASRSLNSIAKFFRFVPPANGVFGAVEGLYKSNGLSDILALKNVLTNATSTASNIYKINGATGQLTTQALTKVINNISETFGARVFAQSSTGLSSLDQESRTVTVLNSSNYVNLKLAVNGKLYGKNSSTGKLVELDPNTGSVISTLTAIPATSECWGVTADMFSIKYALCRERVGTYTIPITTPVTTGPIYGGPVIYRISPTGAMLDKTVFTKFPTYNFKDLGPAIELKFMELAPAVSDIAVDQFGNLLLTLPNKFGASEMLVFPVPTGPSTDPVAISSIRPGIKNISFGMPYNSSAYCTPPTQIGSTISINSIAFNNSRALPQISLWNSASTAGYQNLGNFFMGLVKGSTFTARLTGASASSRLVVYADLSNNGSFQALGTFNGAATVTGALSLPASITVGSTLNLRFALYPNSSAVNACSAATKVVDVRALIN